jgi:hypothetical protein
MCMMESLWLDMAREMERGWEPGLTQFRRPIAPSAEFALVKIAAWLRHAIRRTRQDPASIEHCCGGLIAMGSADGSTRAEDRICGRNLYATAGDRCGQFGGTRAGR